jgi:hypothetical protein
MRRRTVAVLAVVLPGWLHAVSGNAVPPRAFATSVTGAGNLSTWPGAAGATALERADAVCRARAAAGSLPNPAAYRAWISTATTDAFCHVQGLSGTKATRCGGGAPGGYVESQRDGGTRVGARPDDSTHQQFAVSRGGLADEFGTEVTEARLLTGTLLSGVATPGQTCLDWTSSSAGQTLYTGTIRASALQGSGKAIVSCDLEHRLLCLPPGSVESAPAGGLALASSALLADNRSSWP